MYPTDTFSYYLLVLLILLMWFPLYLLNKYFLYIGKDISYFILHILNEVLV